VSTGVAPNRVLKALAIGLQPGSVLTSPAAVPGMFWALATLACPGRGRAVVSSN